VRVHRGGQQVAHTVFEIKLSDDVGYAASDYAEAIVYRHEYVTLDAAFVARQRWKGSQQATALTSVLTRQHAAIPYAHGIEGIGGRVHRGWRAKGPRHGRGWVHGGPD
jgi:hypothetical protein